MSEDQAVDVDAVYRERAHLVAFLAKVFPSRLLADVGESWALLYVDLPSGQASWHISARDLDLFEHVDRARSDEVVWDGHSTEEKYNRLDVVTKVWRRADFHGYTLHGDEDGCVELKHTCQEPGEGQLFGEGRYARLGDVVEATQWHQCKASQ